MPRAVACLLALGSCASLASGAPAHKQTARPATRIALYVDATDVARRVFDVRETISVTPGAITLRYPKWLPGSHAPSGPIDALAGLTFVAGDTPLQWHRDPNDVYSFHVTVPPATRELQIRLQFLSPQSSDQGRITMTPEIVGVQWEKMLLYPAGPKAGEVQVSASLRLPKGWQYGTALRPASTSPDAVIFESTTLETLIDSPVFAGKHFRRETLLADAKAPVYLDIVADTPAELEIQPEQVAAHSRLVQETIGLFGSRHFDRYDLLVAVSNRFGRIGLEHLRSSENGLRRGYFIRGDRVPVHGDTLSHELVHSWNGKFRRPADLWTPDYNAPMQNSLLWVYEGQTTFWGRVLAARSGLWSEEMARGALASVAATYQQKRQGRKWRDLQDTTNDPIISLKGSPSWMSWQRGGTDYYFEGLLLWLDVDTRIRELTGERRSLDDFAGKFFGARDGRQQTYTYTFDDVVRTLNGIAPNDWATFLRTRLQTHDPKALLDGVTRSGWKLAFKPEPAEYQRRSDAYSGRTDHTYSLGLALTADGGILEVVWGSAAFEAGLSTADKVIAVNGESYSAEALSAAIRNAQGTHAPIELIARCLDRYRTIKLDYAGGLRYPHLERIESAPDRLASILRPRHSTPP